MEVNKGELCGFYRQILLLHLQDRERVIVKWHVLSLFLSSNKRSSFKPNSWTAHPPLQISSVCFPGYIVWCGDLRMVMQRANAFIKKAYFTVKCPLQPYPASSPPPPGPHHFSLSFPLSVHPFPWILVTFCLFSAAISQFLFLYWW